MEQKQMQPFWTAVYMQTTETRYYLEPLNRIAGQRKAIVQAVEQMQVEGQTILFPYALTIDKKVNNRIDHKGRAITPPVASMDARFTMVQNSAYKKTPPYKVHTYLWGVNGVQNLYYGTIGITGRNGANIVEVGDLLLIKTEWAGRLVVFVFKGFAILNNGLPTRLTQAVEILQAKGLL